MEAQAFEGSITAAFSNAAALARETVAAGAGCFVVRAATPDAALARDYLRAMLPPRAARGALDLLVLSGAQLDLGHLVPRPAAHGRLHEGERHWLLWQAGVLQVYDRIEKRGLVWLAEGAAPSWELSRPAAALINQAAQVGPCTLVHGAAVGHGGRTLLLVAPGRSGKTSAALACAAAGWDYGGDDYVMVDSESGEVLPMYASARLREDMAAKFPALLRDTRRAISEDGGETRHELDLACVLDPAQLRGGRVAALLVPRRRGARRVEFWRAGPTDAFHAMFAATVQGAPGGLAGHARKLAAFVARAPVYFVDTGPEPAQIPEAFAEFLASLEVSAPAFPG